jgi:iron complex outermembrane receptor protein
MFRNLSTCRSPRIAVACSAVLTALASAPFAVAQTTIDEGQNLEEVVVTTARQREEAVQNVPATVAVLTRETLDSAMVDRAGDFIRLVPGVTMVQTAEVADSQINIRGINGARDAENNFALIIDGILQSNGAAFNREYPDLQQIEIVKGPQGALYGRNAAAGAIIITTTKPTEEFSGEARIGLGEDDTQVGVLTLSGPLTDTMQWKVLGNYRSTDGFYENSFTDAKTVDDFEGWDLYGRLMWEPSDSTTLDIKARYGEVEAASISFNANFLLPGLTQAPLPNAPLFNENANDHNFDYVNNVDPFNNQESFDISVKWDQELSFGTLTAWALYSDIQNEFGSDGTSASYGFFANETTCQSSSAAVFNSGFQLPPPQIIFFAAPGVPPAAIFGPYTPTTCDGTQYQVRNQTDFSFEARIASRGDQRFRWMGGVYFLDLDREVGVNTGIGNGPLIDSLYVPNTPVPGAASIPLPNSTEQLVWDDFGNTVYAGFVNVAYDLTDKWELAAALRYDYEERTDHNKVPTAARTAFFDFNPFDGPFDPVRGYNSNIFVGGAPLNAGLNPVINPSGVIADRDLSFDELQPKVSVTYKATPEFTAYANWGVGFKSGGFNNQGSQETIDLFINCFTGRGPNGELNTDPAVGACGAGTTNQPVYRSVLVEDQYEKETSSAAEIGFKGLNLGGRLQWEVAGFYTDVDNMQFFEFLVGQFGLLRTVNSIDEVELSGFEVGLNWQLTDIFQLNAGYARTYSEIKKNTSRPASVGNNSPYTPDYSTTVGLSADAPITANDWRLQASAWWTVVGPTWFHVIQAQDNPTVLFGDGNYTLAQREEYQTVDVRLALTNGRWTIAALSKNVFDEKYLEEVIPAPEFGGAFIHAGTERRFMGEVTYSF